MLPAINAAGAGVYKILCIAMQTANQQSYIQAEHMASADDSTQHLEWLATATRHGEFPDSCCSKLQSSLVELMTTVSGWSPQQLYMPELDLQSPAAFVGCPRSVLADHQL